MNLFIHSEITEEIAKKIIKKIVNNEEIQSIYISSPGGLVYDALALYDIIQAKSIDTIASGLVASAAVIVLIAGKTRSMHENAWIYLHEGIEELPATRISSAKTTLVQSIRLEKQYCELLAKHSNKSADFYDRLCKKETYLNAQEALKLGLVDRIIKGK